MPSRNTLFQFRRNHKFPRVRVEFDAKHIRLATHLAILYIGLAAAGRFIHRRLVALTTSGTLESGLHVTILGRNRALQEPARNLSIGDSIRNRRRISQSSP
jgi:hypothetical protein